MVRNAADRFWNVFVREVESDKDTNKAKRRQKQKTQSLTLRDFRRFHVRLLKALTPNFTMEMVPELVLNSGEEKDELTRTQLQEIIAEIACKRFVY